METVNGYGSLCQLVYNMSIATALGECL